MSEGYNDVKMKGSSSVYLKNIGENNIGSWSRSSPEIDGDNLFRNGYKLMLDCLNRNPGRRPSFKSIKETYADAPTICTWSRRGTLTLAPNSVLRDTIYYRPGNHSPVSNCVCVIKNWFLSGVLWVQCL